MFICKRCDLHVANKTKNYNKQNNNNIMHVS